MALKDIANPQVSTAAYYQEKTTAEVLEHLKQHGINAQKRKLKSFHIDMTLYATKDAQIELNTARDSEAMDPIASTNYTTQEPAFRFLVLPAEMRNNIYAEAKDLLFDNVYDLTFNIEHDTSGPTKEHTSREIYSTVSSGTGMKKFYPITDPSHEIPCRCRLGR